MLSGDALDLVETRWSLGQELEEAPIHLHEQEVTTALLPAIDKALPSRAPDATRDTTPHPDSSLEFHTWNIRGLWSSKVELQRHTTQFSPLIMVVTETKPDPHDHRSTWMRGSFPGYRQPGLSQADCSMQFVSACVTCQYSLPSCMHASVP